MYLQEVIYSRYKLIKMLLLIITIGWAGCDRKLEINEPDDGLAPAVPSASRVYYSSDGSVGIEWIRNSEADLKGYNIYRSINDSLHFIPAGFTTDDYFIDDSLEYDSTYFYYITAVDRRNLESIPGSVLSARPINRYLPLYPRNFIVNARNWDEQPVFFLSWDPGRESDIYGYKIYRSITADFNPDSSSYLAFSTETVFADTSTPEFYKIYYYRVTALDKGGLESKESGLDSDLLLEMPLPVFPANDTTVPFFDHFRIKTAAAPARYLIILQGNKYFGELWRAEISSTIINDTIDIPLTYYYLEANKTYYWRVAAFTNDNTDPNSFSELFNFKIKQ